MERVILHCDLNCFFASVELLEHPELRDKPVAVCGDPSSRHGIILAKNEAAKKYKVQTAETIWQAQRKCPGLILLPSHHDKYRAYSKRVNAIYERYTDLVEPFGIDESWLDVSGTLHLFGGDARILADEIRHVISSELGLTLSVGVSFNKVFAKLGSDYKKPDATTIISPENWKMIVWPLPVTDLLFVGHSAAQVLGKYGICTIGDLARFDRSALVTLLGKQGGQLYEYANGLERSPVAPAGTVEPPKSVGNGNTFPENLLGEASISRGVALLADSVAMRLRHCGMKCSTVQVIIRDPQFHDLCRQKRTETPTYLARDIAKTAMELIRTSWKFSSPVRALTITGQNLIPEEASSEQMDLFSAEQASQRQRLEKLEHTVDDIRARFGNQSLSYVSAWESGGKTGQSPHDG